MFKYDKVSWKIDLEKCNRLRRETNARKLITLRRKMLRASTPNECPARYSSPTKPKTVITAAAPARNHPCVRSTLLSALLVGMCQGLESGNHDQLVVHPRPTLQTIELLPSSRSIGWPPPCSHCVSKIRNGQNAIEPSALRDDLQ